jgi:hypothetical protein
LPSHLATFRDHLQMAVALCRSGFRRRTRHRAGTWRHDDGGFWMTLANRLSDLILIVPAVGNAARNWTGDLVEHSVSHRGIVAACGIDTDMQLPPGSAAGRSVLFDQPFAGPAELQAGAVHQQVEQASSGTLEARHLQRLRPATQSRMVWHREINS